MINGRLSGKFSFCAGEHRNARQGSGDKQGFVAGFPGVKQNILSIGDNIDRLRVFSSVTAAEDGRLKALLLEQTGQPDYAGRFSCAAGGDIADADDRAGKLDGFQDTPIIKPVAQVNDQPIEQREKKENRSGRTESAAGVIVIPDPLPIDHCCFLHL